MHCRWARAQQFDPNSLNSSHSEHSVGMPPRHGTRVNSGLVKQAARYDKDRMTLDCSPCLHVHCMARIVDMIQDS
jgi:hypothetical protein